MPVTIWAHARLPGFHRWPAATGTRTYLASRHRHLFWITAHAAVTHDDRDTEFHDLRQLICDWWGPRDRECGAASCETMARDLVGYLARRGVTVVAVEVSEDGESGARYEPEPATP